MIRINRYIGNIKKLLLRNWATSSKPVKERSSEIFEYTFEYSYESGTNIPVKAMKQIVLQNPWSTVATPVINFSTNEEGEE